MRSLMPWKKELPFIIPMILLDKFFAITGWWIHDASPTPSMRSGILRNTIRRRSSRALMPEKSFFTVRCSSSGCSNCIGRQNRDRHFFYDNDRPAQLGSMKGQGTGILCCKAQKRCDKPTFDFCQNAKNLGCDCTLKEKERRRKMARIPRMLVTERK